MSPSSSQPFRLLAAWIEYAAVRGLLASLGALPRPAAIVTGRVLGRLAGTALWRLRRTAGRNLHIAFPDLAEDARRRLLWRSFDMMGRQLGEFSQFPKADAASLRQIIEYDASSSALLSEARGRGKGILFITGHLGAWELLVFAQSALEGPISFVARQIENPRVEALVRSIRCRLGNQAVDKTSAGLGALRVLRKGGIFGVLADLNTLPQEGVFVPFFGHLACTAAGIAALALQADATLFPVFAPWIPDRRRYLFQGGPMIELIRTGDHARDVEVNTARIAAVLESHIRRFPDQWLWIHERWRARPRPGDRVCTEFPPVEARCGE